MNRKEFFKRLGIGLGVAIVAPKVFGGEKEHTFYIEGDKVTFKKY
jgi:hypothetical protein